MEMFLLIVIVAIISILINYNMILKKEIDSFNSELLKFKEKFVAHSEAADMLTKYKKTRNKCFIKIASYIVDFVHIYDDFYNYIEKHNEEFIKNELIKNKEYFDNLFEYPLDEEQRRAIITDDDNNLIVAGAGSGKTTTIIGKTKYLIEQKGVNPEEIITISFTNAAKDNFVEKLKDNRVKCSTFHKLGKDILDEGLVKIDIAPEDFLRTIIRDYISNEIYKYPEKASILISFYAFYMHSKNGLDKDIGDVIELEKGYDLETLKYKYHKVKNLETLKQEKVKSEQELIIANYLFLHGINYEYEPRYKYPTANKVYTQYHPDFYLKDYDIYLEHFGINKEGRAPQYNEIEEIKYLDGIEFKRNLHKKYNTKLIETYSYDFDDYKIEDVLEEKLKSNGIKYNDIDYKEIVETISLINNEEMKAFCSLINKFIKMFKGNNYLEDEFDNFYIDAKNKKNKRNMYLLEIIKGIYIYYQNKLPENNYIDFDDMINLATEKVINEYNKKISYIIIDEFQDTSYSRYSLVKAIQDKTNAKVVAVGDDWQSIYRFSGCDLDLFVNFKKYFPYPKIMYISYTYRNSQNLIDISSSFIMKNEKGQIQKSIKSNKENLANPIEFLYYKNNIRAATESAIKKLKKLNCKKIAILGRNNFDIEKKYNIKPDLTKKEIDLSSVFDYNVVFTTVHKSKGLEYDGVIICNIENYIAGFPNKMEDDPVLEYVSLTKDDYLYEEERRLFYVALTRTKTKCMLLVPTNNPSIFVNELYEISQNQIPQNIIEDDERLHNPKCPKCQTGILVTRTSELNNSKFVGCSNYPGCDFIYKTTDILENTIRCPKCNSYMVKRNSSRGVFYGCINYPYCNQTIENANNVYYQNNIRLETKTNNSMEKKNISKDFSHKKLYVDVRFGSSPKIYSYLCNSNFKYKPGDRIRIHTSNSFRPEVVTVVKGPYYDNKNDYSYKQIDVDE